MNVAGDYHKDHKEWRSRLDFYKGEIIFFYKELNLIFDKDKENLARMEFIDEYENILGKHLEQNEALIHRVELAEKLLLSENIDKKTKQEHYRLHLDLLQFEETYSEMRKRFKRYASLND